MTDVASPNVVVADDEFRELLKAEAYDDNEPDVSVWLRSDETIDRTFTELKGLMTELQAQLTEYNQHYEAGTEKRGAEWRNRTVSLRARLKALLAEIEPLAKDWRRRTLSATVDSTGYARRFGKLGKAIAKHRKHVCQSGRMPTAEDQRLWDEYDQIIEEHQRARGGT